MGSHGPGHEARARHIVVACGNINQFVVVDALVPRSPPLPRRQRIRISTDVKVFTVVATCSEGFLYITVQIQPNSET